ncbi:hypothetical protein NW766_012717 [Fusarium irregulare]|uniref:Uncharacterized protein n=1 Tax=Fusarium irregulare TaxID=2494466 RepID=A0A9W8U4J7_9HYPO|nr:hypothetical protein NW766_012717 [Fusarium irregulare]
MSHAKGVSSEIAAPRKGTVARLTRTAVKATHKTATLKPTSSMDDVSSTSEATSSADDATSADSTSTSEATSSTDDVTSIDSTSTSEAASSTDADSSSPSTVSSSAGTKAGMTVGFVIIQIGAIGLFAWL